MALDTALLFILAPEFTTDSRAATFLALSEQQHSPIPWGNVYSQAMAYHCAHCLTTAPVISGAGPGGGSVGSGPVTARKAGDVEVSYGSANSSGYYAATPTEAEMMQTAYGRRYLSLRDGRSAPRPLVTRVNR